MRRLTIKEAKLVKAKAQGKTHVEAYNEAGYSPGIEKKSIQVAKIINRPAVNEALQRALKKHEITLDNALAPIGEALLYQDPENPREALDMRLKGSKEATKLMPELRNPSISLNFHQHLVSQEKDYDL